MRTLPFRSAICVAVAAMISCPCYAASGLVPGEVPPRIKAFCIDFNWGPEGFAPPGMYAHASPREHVAWYRALGVNTIQTFCASCPGYAWYKSKVAPVQPGMQGDFLKELTDPDKLSRSRSLVGPATRLIQCICGWGDQHNAEEILSDPDFAEIGVYGFAKPDPVTTLPPEDGSANARNIAAIRRVLNAR